MTTLAAALLRNQAAPIDAVENAMLRQSLYGGDLATNLLELAAIDEVSLLDQLAQTFEMPAAPYGALPVATEQIKKALPAESGARHCIYPLELAGDELIVAVSVPLTPNTLEDLAFSLGYELRQKIALEVRIRQALSRDYRLPLAERFVRLSLSLDSGQPLNLSIPPPKVARRLLDSPRSEAPRPEESVTTTVPTLISSRQAIFAQSPPQIVRTPAAHTGRRLGPFTAAMAEAELKKSTTAKEALRVWLDFSAQYFEFAAVFTVQGDVATGFEARGAGPSTEYMTRVSVPLQHPNVLADARRLGHFNLAELSEDGINATLARDIERKVGRKVFVIPAALRGRTVAVLFGDQGNADVELKQVGDVVAFSGIIERALEIVLVSRKRGLSIEPPGNIVAARIPTSVSAPAPSTAPSADPASIAAHSHSRSGSAGTQYAPNPTPISNLAVSAHAKLPVSRPPASLRSDGLTAQRAEGAVLHGARQPDELRPIGLARPIVEISPSNAAGNAERITKLTNEGPDTGLSNGTRVPSAWPEATIETHNGESLTSTRPVAAADVSMPRVESDYEARSLAIIDKIKAGDEAAIQDLVACGDAGASVLVRELPGPIAMPARAVRPDLGPLRASDCGPLLRAMVAFGTTARPYVIARTADADPRVRQWTTRLLGELPGRQAAMAVAQRLMHDRDPEVRRAAFAGGQMLIRDAESATALRAALLGAARNEALAVTQRLSSIDALSDLRDAQAIPALLGLLQDPNPSIAAAVRQALATIACHDFRQDIEAWKHWWAHNSQRHRVEWLIDALTDELAPIRQSAADELRTLSRLYVGHFDDENPEQRARVQDRYRAWWNSAGHLSFQADGGN